jgi:hypothetical protein
MFQAIFHPNTFRL